jgi:hypothetical protein
LHALQMLLLSALNTEIFFWPEEWTNIPQSEWPSSKVM